MRSGTVTVVSSSSYQAASPVFPVTRTTSNTEIIDKYKSRPTRAAALSLVKKFENRVPVHAAKRTLTFS